MLKKIIGSTLIGTIVIVMSGCGPSQADLLKEKQKQEKIRLDKLKKEKALEEKNLDEAKKYLSLKNDNNIIWNKIDEINKHLDKSPYETHEEYNKRITLLNKTVFNRKFIFDYLPKYNMYDIQTHKLYLEVIYSRAHMSKYGFSPQNKITLSSKNIGTRNINGNLMKKTMYLRSNFVCSNVAGMDYYKNNSGPSKRNYQYSAVVLKDNCSPSEAQEIQRNWKIRFVSNVKYRKKQKMGTFNTYFDIVNTDMIVVFNSKTKEIYKVLY